MQETTKIRAAALTGLIVGFVALGSGTAAASPLDVDGPTWLPPPWRQIVTDVRHRRYLIGILSGA
ncbi:hypothetical protein [Rhodococcus aetherivorans]|uniref:hypothetical protein n=1 Tax=Rhodococcus aetherivorans TaxID=191292 RepID=UPI0016396D51|nr:hypothetical protein [Rhodococcus aetherivorans]MBC2592345.1 hypothetical protein [Rhodococcus aetherivorans]